MSDLIDAPVEPGKTLAIPAALTAAQAYAPGRIEELLSGIETEARADAVGLDAATPASRAALKSLAYKVARSKTALDDMGKSLGEDLRRQKDAIDSERRLVRSRLDALAEEIRAPVTDWQNAEASRIGEHEAALLAITTLTEHPADMLAAEIAALLARAQTIGGNRDWQEYAERAAAARAEAIRLLTADMERQHKYEAVRGELARRRVVAEARRQSEEAADRKRQQADLEARIAAEAAERARQAAEASAAAEIARAERERRIAEEAAQRAEAERQAAEERTSREAAAAVEAERRRVAQAEAAERAAAEARAADRARRGRVNRAARDALMQHAGLTEEQATAAVTAVAAGRVPHMTITY